MTEGEPKGSGTSFGRRSLGQRQRIIASGRIQRAARNSGLRSWQWFALMDMVQTLLWVFAGRQVNAKGVQEAGLG